MKKNRIGGRILAFILAAAIALTTQKGMVLATENQEGEETETHDDTAAVDNGPVDADSLYNADQPDDSVDTGSLDNTGDADDADSLGGTDDSVGTDSLGDADDPEDADDLDETGDIDVLDDSSNSGSTNGLPADLTAYTVKGLNPDGAIVNLFDYWQDTNDHGFEVPHDYDTTASDGAPLEYRTYRLGISENHLLRFGYRDTGGTCETCLDTRLSTHDKWWTNWNDTVKSLYYGQGFYGDWNEYNIDTSSGRVYGGLREGIVQKVLNGGFPALNLDPNGKADGDFFGDYTKDTKFEDDYKAKTNESLSYLFSPDDTTVEGIYRKSYTNVQGLFQRDAQGYYFYNSEINFAELNAASTSNNIILYNSPGVGKTAGDQTSTDYSEANYGQFFPFNTAQDVFDSTYVGSDGKKYLCYNGLKYDSNDASTKDWASITNNNVGFMQCYAPNLNHYLGMTLEVPFLQPANGEVANGLPMEFEFSGDDDVWIFIDGVLVADLGGIHDAYYLKIDFSTGNVSICKNSEKEQATSPAYQTHTLQDSFTAAGVNDVAFTGNTFASNTVHTLKMFYLERGHMASNLSLKFNLQVARYDQIRKVDQDGKPISGVAFDLYEAAVCSAGESGAIPCTTSTQTTSANAPIYVKDTGQLLATITTGQDGIADFTGYSFSDSEGQYYILKEKSVPSGYRAPPVDIVLEYSYANTSTKVLRVANRWESGAYASFTSYVNERVNTPIYYAQYDSVTGTIQATKSEDNEVGSDSRQNGLVLAVPMLKNQSEWLPLYGSNVEGFKEIKPSETRSGDMKEALLTAALMQAALNADSSKKSEAWYLQWDDGTQGLVGILTDLPGRADRYRLLNSAGDMQMAYIMIEPEVFTNVIKGSGSTSDDRYTALKNYVGKDVKTAVANIYGTSGTDIKLLDTSDFMRVFRALIYIPNVQRELRVKKIDESGQPISGATFAIYKDKGCTIPVSGAQGTTATVGGEEGILIFQPNAPSEAGYAPINWETGETYYLKETSAPAEYWINTTVVPIVVDAYSVYADAGGNDDGVSVEARVGHLYQTMTKYASDGEVNVTLHDIIATERGKSSGNFGERWTSKGNTLTLSYDNNVKDYFAANSAAQFFSTETGFISVFVQQGAYSGTYASAIRDNLTGVDLTGLFSQFNVVVVKDRSIPGEQKELRVQKVDESGNPLNGAEFGLYDENDNLVAWGTTAFADGQNGVLIFQVKENGTQTTADGFARWEEYQWKEGNYYLQEISPPPGYQSNPQKIPVVVDGSGVYADAGTEDDGVWVKAGVGYYKVNSTPPGTITVSAQGKDSEAFDAFSQTSWKALDALGDKELSYKNYPTMGMDYELAAGSSGTMPFFETDTGFIRNAVKDSSGQTYITDDFSQLNIVMVKDQKTDNPDDPENPENPDNPDNPENPDNPDPDTGPDPEESPETDGNPDSVRESLVTGTKKLLNRIETAAETLTGTPQTGDDSLIWWWGLLSITSLSGIAATVSNLIVRKKKQEKNPSKEKQKKQREPKEKQKKQREPKEKQKKQREPKEKQKRQHVPKEKQKKQRPSKRKQRKPLPKG